VYSYIDDNIPSGAKIANDHFVAIPPDKNIIDCDYWSQCSTIDALENLQPDYVIFSEDWKFSNQETVPETQQYIDYVKEHHYVLIDTLRHDSVKITISVYKKPDP
jgi:hypothetical protein